ncbi:MAG: 4Fe-4S binding protein [Sedimentisphaerales bacterium]|nr:4Fe-4S binding protein [Sedimentisphaerales bacterium]
MVKRNIIKIDEDKCNGCGQCVNACAEGAIQIINGKAKLISEIYCDGLGACLGTCPQDAITIEQREAAEFDEEATKKHLANTKNTGKSVDFLCPGLMAAKIRDKNDQDASPTAVAGVSRLSHWPVQLKLVSPAAPYFADADLLLVADCVPFAMGDFHEKFLKNHSVVVGCPKLDDSSFYVDKLGQILTANKLKSLTVVHMEVPCCRGLTQIVKQAISKNKIEMAFEDVTIDLQGNISRTETLPT